MKRLIKVQFRRRRQNKTDYLARKRFLESGIARLVLRKTNRYIITQIVESKEAQDRVICSANSKELLEYGLPETYSIKNLSASYLTGYLCGVKAIKKGIKKAILDIGLLKSTKGNKIYAVLKGAIDSGLEIPHSKEILIPEEKLKIDVHVKKSIKEKND